MLDRNTGQTVSNGVNKPFPIASVAKLFIADGLLLQESEGRAKLSAADRQSLDSMLRSSDDGAIGPDRRYVMAISSLESDDAAAARETMTQAVKTMFPGGKI